MIALPALVVLIFWALNRNQRRQIRTVSDNGVPDRDLERLVADLRAADPGRRVPDRFGLTNS